MNDVGVLIIIMNFYLTYSSESWIVKNHKLVPTVGLYSRFSKSQVVDFIKGYDILGSTASRLCHFMFQGPPFSTSIVMHH